MEKLAWHSMEVCKAVQARLIRGILQLTMWNTLRFGWNLLTVWNPAFWSVRIMSDRWYRLAIQRAPLLWEFWNNCKSHNLIFRYKWRYPIFKTLSGHLAFFLYLRSSEIEICSQKAKVRTGWSMLWIQLLHSCSKEMIPKQNLDLPYENIILKEDERILPVIYDKT